jgi:hypothetical protein
MGKTVSDEDYAAAILGSLPSSYKPLIDSISMAARMADKKPPPADIMQWVTEEFEGREDHDRRNKKDDAALAAKGFKTKSKSKVTCYNCGKVGHTKAECWEEGGGMEGQRPERKGKFKGKGKGHGESANAANANKATKNAPDPDNYAFSLIDDPPDETAAPATQKPQGGTMLDSAASSHLTGLKNELRNLKEDERGVKGTNGKVFTTHQSGEMTVRLPNGDATTSVTLKDTLYHPDTPYTLISIGRMEAAGFTIIFKGGECRIIAPNGNVIGTVPRVNYLYNLDNIVIPAQSETAAATTTKMTLTQLHRRMGHVSARSLKFMLSQGMVTGLDVDTSIDVEFCEACAKAKLKRAPIPKKRSNKRPAKNFGDRVSSDLWGPAQVDSISGNKYFVSFIVFFT